MNRAGDLAPIEKIIIRGCLARTMPKGLKQTSSLIVIGASVTETAPNTFTESRVDLQLNPLDNEVFVVTGIDMDVSVPDGIAGADTRSAMAITTTSQSSFPSLALTACLARKSLNIQAAGFVDGGVGFQESAGDTPPATLDYVGIIATNDFFLQIIGVANAVAKSGAIKLYGYRARADASTYAALVQSEVLSS